MSASAPVAVDLLTAAEVCERLRRDEVGTWEPGTVWAWTREVPPLPIALQGKAGREHRYDYGTVVEWLAGRSERVEQNRDPRLQKAREEARLARLRADELERRLVPADEVEAAMGRVVDAARTALESLPRRLVQLLRGVDGDVERDAIIDAEIRRVLERMARGQAADDDDEAATS